MTEVLKTVTDVFNGTFKNWIESITKEFGEEVKHVVNNNMLEYQVEEYNRNLFTKTLLHRVQPKKLYEFYQPLFIRSCDRKKTLGLNPNQQRIPTNSVSELFKKSRYITLLGNAGSGKSTIVKYLFLNAIDSNFKIPIKIELRYLNDFNGNLIDYIKERIFKLERIATNDRIIERLLSSGKYIIFLDGYDEITSSKKERLTKEIDDLVKLYAENCYLLTSRPYTNIDLLPLFNNYEVCELNDEDINQFINKQIPNEESELCDKIKEAVHNPENISYKSFLSNPLLLSMFILTFQSYSNIPQKRSEFYSQVFDALFSVHDSMSKLAYVREKQSGLPKEQFVEVLKLFSFISYFDEKFIFSSNYLEQKLNIIKDKKKNISFDNSKLVNDLQVAIGILNKEGTEFTFPHRSLQEYFAALYISNLDTGNKNTVYSKIITTLIDTKKLRLMSRDNFFLLLSELDEKNVINLAILPFLENQLVVLKESIFNNWKKNIDLFVSIQSIFDAFAYVLKNPDFRNYDEQLHRKFAMYRQELIDSGQNDSKKSDAVGEKARKRLGEQDLPNVLTELIPKIEDKVKELKQYLAESKSSDSEIIDLI